MAGNGFSTLTFQQLIDDGVLEIGDGYRAKNNELGGDGPIFLRAGHVSDSHIDFDGVEHFHAELEDKVRHKMARPGDTIVTTKGNSTGRTSFVTDRMPTFVYSPHLSYWRSADASRIENGFLRYWSRGREFTNQLAGMKASTDMAPYLSLTDQRRLKITLPPLSEQKAIAEILGGLDAKIELNRRMNETLESLARALFKSWFVDFDPVRAKLDGRPPPGLPPATAALFPDKLEHVNGELIPSGWRFATIDGCTSLIIDYRGKTPKKLGYDWAPSGIPAVSAKNVKNGRLIRPDTFKFVDDDLYARWMKDELAIGDTLMTSEAPLGEMYYLALNANLCLSQRLYGIRANSGFCESTYLYHWLASGDAQADMESRATGTTVVGIRQSELRKVRVLIPPIEIQTEAAKVFSASMEKIHRNEAESETLAALRDTLLPRLLSGELRVADAEPISS